MREYEGRRLDESVRDSKDHFESLTAFPPEFFPDIEGESSTSSPTKDIGSHLYEDILVVPARRKVEVPYIMVETPNLSTSALATHMDSHLKISDCLITTSSQCNSAPPNAKYVIRSVCKSLSKPYKRPYSPASITSLSSPKSMEKFVK